MYESYDELKRDIEQLERKVEDNEYEMRQLRSDLESLQYQVARKAERSHYHEGDG